MSLVVCQLSCDVIGYEDSNVIGQFRSVFLSQLNSHLLLVKLSAIGHFCRCQFCLSPSISRLHVMNTELLVGGCNSDGDAHKHSFKGCFSQLYAAGGVINYGYFNVNCM